jgi:hypothetical protein
MRSRRLRRFALAAVAASAVGVLPLAHEASAASSPAVGIVSMYYGATPTGNRTAYYVAFADGAVRTFGSRATDSKLLGDMAGRRLNSPIRGIVEVQPGTTTARSTLINGYWLYAADGGVFAFGDAGFYGSMAGRPLNSPIVAMMATPTGKGYWQVAADGGVFAFGDAPFYGSLGALKLNSPIVDAVANTTGRGYYMLGGDGGVFRFGPDATIGYNAVDAAPGTKYSAIVLTARGTGLRIISEAGVVNNSGLAIPLIDSSTAKPGSKVVDAASNPETGSTTGYYLLLADGGIFNYGVPFLGNGLV